MLIADYECFVVRNQIAPRTGVSILYVDSFAYVVVKLVDADGMVGWGETYAASGVFEAVGAAAASLVGRPGSLRALQDHVRFGYGSIHGGGFAVSAVGLALEDLAARRAGVSVAETFGGPVRERVRAYAASGGYTEGEHPSATWPAELERALAGGFTALKLRIGGYPIEVEAEIIAELVERAPHGFELLVDGNAGYTFPEAVRMGRILGDLGVGWFEEPLVQRGYVGYAELTRSVDIAVAGGEGIVHRADAARHLAARFVDVIQPDPVICGGVREALFIAELAAAHGVQATPHTSNSAIGITAGIHVLASVPDATRAMHRCVEPLLEFGIDGSVWRDALLVEPHRVRDGYVGVPTGPGWGIDIDEARLREVAVASCRHRA